MCGAGWRRGPSPRFALVSAGVGVVERHLQGSFHRVTATWWKEYR